MKTLTKSLAIILSATLMVPWGSLNDLACAGQYPTVTNQTKPTEYNSKQIIGDTNNPNIGQLASNVGFGGTVAPFMNGYKGANVQILTGPNARVTPQAVTLPQTNSPTVTTTLPPAPNVAAAPAVTSSGGSSGSGSDLMSYLPLALTFLQSQGGNNSSGSNKSATGGAPTGAAGNGSNAGGNSATQGATPDSSGSTNWMQSLMQFLPMILMLAGGSGNNSSSMLPIMMMMMGGMGGLGGSGSASGSNNSMMMMLPLLLSGMLNKQSTPAASMKGIDTATGQTATFTRDISSTVNSNSSSNQLSSILPYLLQGMGGSNGGGNSNSMMSLLPLLLSQQQSSNALPASETQWTLAGETGNYYHKIISGTDYFVPVGEHKMPNGDDVIYTSDGSGDWLQKFTASTGYTFQKQAGQSDSQAVLKTVAAGPNGDQLNALSSAQFSSLLANQDPLVNYASIPSNAQILSGSATALPAAVISSLGLNAPPPTNMYMFLPSASDPTQGSIVKIGYQVNSDGSWVLYSLDGLQTVIRKGDANGNVNDATGKQLIIAQAPLDLGNLGQGTAAHLTLDPTSGFFVDKTTGIEYTQSNGTAGTIYTPKGVLDSTGHPVLAQNNGSVIHDAYGNTISVAYVDQKGMQYFHDAAGDLLPVVTPVANPNGSGPQLNLVVTNAASGIYSNPGTDQTYMYQAASGGSGGSSGAGGLMPYTGHFNLDATTIGDYTVSNGQRILASIAGTLPNGNAVMLTRVDDTHYQTTDATLGNQQYTVTLPNGGGTPTYTAFNGQFQEGVETVTLSHGLTLKIASGGNEVDFDASGSLPISLSYQGTTLPIVQRQTNSQGTFDITGTKNITVQGVSGLPQAYDIMETANTTNGQASVTMPTPEFVYAIDTSNVSDRTISVTNSVTGTQSVWNYDATGHFMNCTGACTENLPPQASFPM